MSKKPRNPDFAFTPPSKPSKREARLLGRALGGIGQIAIFWAIGEVDASAAQEIPAMREAFALCRRQGKA